MHSSDSDGVSTSLLGNRATSPPTAQRSSKSVVSQVKETLFSFIKKARGETNSISQKQREIESFTERVATFTVSKWMGKPLALSPPLFAQYGWQCIGVDTIKCCSCSSVMCVRLPWPDAENYRQQCFNYRQKVITSHMKICSWPSYPCSNSFVAPFLHGGHSSSDILTQFSRRQENLMRLGSKLPNLDPDVLTSLKLDEKNLKTLENLQPQLSDAPETEEHSENESPKLSQSTTAAILAMCGWDTSHTSISSSPTIICRSSGRVITLHNFFSIGNQSQPSDNEETTSQTSDLLSNNKNSGLKRRLSGAFDEGPDSPMKRLKTTNGDSTSSPSRLNAIKQDFNPLEQHSPWSFWIAVLKPISKEEFESDAAKKGPSATNNDQNEDLYHFIINPVVKEARPGWLNVRDAIFGKKNASEKGTKVQTEVSQLVTEGNLVKNVPEDLGVEIIKTPAKSPVIHVRKLLKEWSHRK